MDVTQELPGMPRDTLPHLHTSPAWGKALPSGGSCVSCTVCSGGPVQHGMKSQLFVGSLARLVLLSTGRVLFVENQTHLLPPEPPQTGSHRGFLCTGQRRCPRGGQCLCTLSIFVPPGSWHCSQSTAKGFWICSGVCLILCEQLCRASIPQLSCWHHLPAPAPPWDARGNSSGAARMWQ